MNYAKVYNIAATRARPATRDVASSELAELISVVETEAEFAAADASEDDDMDMVVGMLVELLADTDEEDEMTEDIPDAADWAEEDAEVTPAPPLLA